MLKFVIGTAGTGKSAYITNQIISLAQQGEKCLLIVPEQFSKTGESILFSALEDARASLVSLYSFTSLMRDVQNNHRRLAGKVLDGAGKAVMARRAADRCKNRLQLYSRQTAHFPFAYSLAGLFDDFKRSGISARGLYRLVGSMPQKSPKLKELSRIYSEYCGIISDGFCDGEDLLLLLSQVLPDRYTRDTPIFVDGFESFSFGQLAVLKNMMGAGKDITFALTCDSLYDTSGGTGNFSFVQNTAAQLIKAAKEAMDTHGYGMSSVRFICGTQDLHKQLEAAISDYFKTEDTILYAACFDANGGLFEPLFTEEDAIISDSLNHASIIDGVRLCKAKRYRYANADMADLERCLQEAQAQRYRIIATDGVFSMDGNVAPMDKICDLAEKYDALVMVDESHSAGVVGPTGHGVAEQFNCYGRIDIFTGTLGKAFGGAMGGFTTGKKEIIDMLRQRSRPYLFSNSVAPAIVGASLEMFKMLKESDALHTKLMNNVNYFRDKMMAAGFDIKPTQSAICAVMLYDAKLSQDFAAKMQEEGIYVTGFYYPVVPKGQARIRVQLSAGHETEHLDKAIAAFIKVGKELNVIK